jgi:cation diffusion facilitator CzcD-associated flavoprotein CzcO
VLVVGLGNTGAEIALDLCDRGIEVAISVRGAVNVVPRDVLGRPTQLTALALARLPPRIGDPIGRLLRRLTVGDLTRFGIRPPDVAPLEQLRRYGRTPVIDIGTVDRIRAGRIAVFPAIERFVPGGVVFVDGRESPFDVVILATGYRARLEALLPDARELLDEDGTPTVVVGAGAHAGLYFCGFDNHQPGGILGTIVGESATIAEAIGVRS